MDIGGLFYATGPATTSAQETMSYTFTIDNIKKMFVVAYSGEVTLAEREKAIKEGTPVIAGLFDVDACGIGAGLISPDQICSIAGTWNINMGITKNYTRNDAIRQCTIRGDGSHYLMYL